jgi:hypothetical protein
MVVDIVGKPVKDAEVLARNNRGEGGRARTAEDGSFEVALADREGNSLSIFCSGYSETTVRDVKDGGAEQRIVLQRLNSLELRMVRADTGEPLREFQVRVERGGHSRDRAEIEAALAKASARFLQGLCLTGKVLSGDGTFRAENLDMGPKLVAVRAPGMQLALQPVVVPPAEQGPGRALVRLTPDSAPLTGRVLDSMDRPVSGAAVWIDERPVVSTREASMGRRVALAETGGDGAFQITGLLPGKVYICAHHPDHAPASLRMDMGREPASVELKFPATGVLEGRVTLGGKPLAEVDVSCRYPAEPQDAYDSAKTAGDGTFRFGYALPGVASLYAHLYEGRDLSRKLDAKVAAGRLTHIELDLPAGTASLEGTVTVNGVPAENVSVDLHLPVSEGSARLQAAFSGSRYHLEELPAGACTVQVNAAIEGSNSTAGEASLTLTEGQTTVQDFAL